jgi:hypothetical protein
VSNWWIGDLATYADQWGDEYVQLLDGLGIEYETLRKFAMVAKQVPIGIRIPEVSWSHHRLVSALPSKDQRRWLAKAQPLEGETRGPADIRPVAGLPDARGNF